MKRILLPVFILVGVVMSAQNKNALGDVVQNNFTHQDTLRGSNTKFRDFWDVQKYEIEVEPNYAGKSVKGTNRISFKFTKDVTNPVMQIDIQQPMQVSDLISDFELGTRNREGNFLFVQAKGTYKKGEQHFLSLDFKGNPMIAKRPPWDGGWIFTTDPSGKPWMATATEGIGTSVWLPMKDYWGDKPDQGITFTVIAPKDLVGVANGRLEDSHIENDKNYSFWVTKDPVNMYGAVPYFGDYVHFSDTFNGEKGPLSLNYYVIRGNLDKAKKQFAQVPLMLKAFEYWFGPYPFYQDGYKLVEAPYLGMENQSDIAYGNHYENGYLGRDLSGTGVGLKFDFIIIHESAHEWFANNITAKDPADMWIHESFACYAETLYTEYNFGKKDADAYLIGERKNIQNDIPIIGYYGVNNEGSGDMYYKGASMLHTIRQVINNDQKFRDILRGLNSTFYHQTVTSKQIEDYINQKSGINFSSVFQQYLTTIKVPKLEYKQDGKKLSYRYSDIVPGFTLPIRFQDNGQTISINPTSEWQTIKLKKKQAPVWDPNYYVIYTETK